MDSWLVPVLIGDSRPGRIDVPAVGICCPWGRELGQGEQALSSTAFSVALHGVGSRKLASPNFRRRGDFPGLWFLPRGIWLRHLWKISPASEEQRCLVFVVLVAVSFFFLKKTLYIKHLVLKKKKKKKQASTKCFKILFWICFFFLRLPAHDKGRLTEETGRYLLILLRWVEL